MTGLLKLYWLIVFAPSLALIVGCVNDNGISDQGYGNAVHHMIAIQTSNPGRSAYGLDGQKAMLALEKYKKDVANPSEIDSEELTGSTQAVGR